MRESQKKVIKLTNQIGKRMEKLYDLLYEELSRPDKAFDIEYDGQSYQFFPPTTVAEAVEQSFPRGLLICRIIKDAVNDKDWSNVIALVSGADPADHQIEIIKESYDADLDQDGKQITAKPLDHDSVYVQWQDESKFKFEDRDGNES